ncbi:MAG: tripartite tricarboxylate transporter substrate binding protein [Alcaligenaceae bacterium]|nr:tripartite tricarboxylate transporter substrate binding protein [Alcaligenaceae bacterium]
MKTLKFALWITAFCLTSAASGQQTSPTIAQAATSTYPNKPVTLIVAFPPGGGTDIVARRVAQGLNTAWGQSVIVDNKGGAGGTIGTALAARAEPNGYTIMLATLGNMAINPHLYKMEIDPSKDLAAITNVVGVTFVLVAHPSLPANNVQELLALAKQKPGKLNYSSSGTGGAPHLAIELLASMTDTQFTHVPYKGSGPSFTDLVGGQVDFTMDSLVQSLPHIQSGRLKVLAVLSAKRSPVLPAVPTVAESGVPGYDFTNWFGFVAPAQTPKEVITQLHRDIASVLSQPALREQLEKMGTEVIASTPEQFSAQIRSDTDKWAKIVKERNIKPD